MTSRADASLDPTYQLLFASTAFYTRIVSRDVGRGHAKGRSVLRHAFSLAIYVRKQTYPSERLSRAGRIALRVTRKNL